MAGFAGVLQIDGYAGYKRLGSGNAVSLAFCWTHVRRGFFEQKDSPLAADVLKQIARLYAIEDEIRGAPPETRRALRQAEAEPIVDDLKTLLEAKLPLLIKKSKLAEATRYALARWEGLTRFLRDGRIELDNNVVERSIRPSALNRKNALFAGSDDGAQHWAVIASLIETCKLNNADPQAWLAATLTKLAHGHPITRLAELMPWAYASGLNSLR